MKNPAGKCRGGEQQACVVRERQEREAADREITARERSVVLFGLSNWDDDHHIASSASFPLATDLAFGNLSERAK
jgi:hypothetical protein